MRNTDLYPEISAVQKDAAVMSSPRCAVFSEDSISTLRLSAKNATESISRLIKIQSEKSE